MPDADAEAPVTEQIAPVTETPVVDEDVAKRWKKTLIVVGNHRIPSGNKRPVIVVESREFKLDDKGQVTGTTLKTDGYPAGADLYYRTDPEVKFPADAEGKTITLGVDVEQGLIWGFSPHPHYVHTGPFYPSYSAANLAYLRGAEDIEIVGLSEHEKEKLKPFIEGLKDGGPQPRPLKEGFGPDVRCPADVKITLT